MIFQGHDDVIASAKAETPKMNPSFSLPFFEFFCLEELLQSWPIWQKARNVRLFWNSPKYFNCITRKKCVKHSPDQDPGLLLLGSGEQSSTSSRRLRRSPRVTESTWTLLMEKTTQNDHDLGSRGETSFWNLPSSTTHWVVQCCSLRTHTHTNLFIFI